MAATHSINLAQALVGALLLSCLGCDPDRSQQDSPGSKDVTGTGTAAVEVASNPRSSESTPQPKPAVVFLGDSLTAGRGLSEQEAVPALIQKKADAAGYGVTVINAGRSGDTTAGGLSRLSWYLRESVNAQVLVIGLGSNDAMRGQPLESIQTNLEKLVDAARAARPSLQILLWQLQTFPNMGADYGDAYAALFAEVARSKQVTLIPFPLAGVAANPELNQSDGIHPTAEGSKVVAANIWKTLESSLRLFSKQEGQAK